MKMTPNLFQFLKVLHIICVHLHSLKVFSLYTVGGAVAILCIFTVFNTAPDLGSLCKSLVTPNENCTQFYLFFFFTGDQITKSSKRTAG